MAPRNRIDAELVRRKIAVDKKAAKELITAGRVLCNGMPVTTAARIVNPSDSIVVKEATEHEWASRGAHKLLGAIKQFTGEGFSIDNKRCLDAGASTGGFTDVLLHHGAKEVMAVDVGYGQLIWRIQNDDRVTVFDRTNVRHLSPEIIGGTVDLVVSDLSFISLQQVLQPLLSCCEPESELMLMVKPQFEVSPERISDGGVVRDPQFRADAVYQVGRRALELGCAVKGVGASPLPGPSGNVEYFLWLAASAESEALLLTDRCIMGTSDDNLHALHKLVQQAVKEGPQ